MGVHPTKLMKTPKVNLIDPDHRDGRGGALPVLLAVFAIFACSFAFGRMTQSQGGEEALTVLDSVPIIGQMRHLMGSPDRKLNGETDDRINILLLGMGGEGHEGPLLTDTIMVASIRPTDAKVALLSIPRDLIVPLPGIGWRKINSANAFGELKQAGGGAETARQAIEGLLGIPIPYYVRVDFRGFTELIDGVGGIDVYIDKNFTDASYPTDDYGYQTVSFAKGWEHMSGARALIYTRSRHGTNGEGNDFARARRQQKALSALKDKLLDLRTFRTPAAVSDTLAALRANISTNLQVGDILRLARIGTQVDAAQITHEVLDNGKDSPLTDAYLGGAYVLVPKNDDWNGVREVASRLFDRAEPETMTPPPPKPPETVAATAVKPRVEVRNGTDVSGEARSVAQKLSSKGFIVAKIGNAASANIAKTVVYDMRGGADPTRLAQITAELGDPRIVRMEGRLAGEAAPAADIDFLIIIGQDSVE